MISIEDITAVRCLPDEQETTISYSRKDDAVDIYTSDNTVITKIKRLMVKDTSIVCTSATYNKNHEPTSYCFKATKKNLSFRVKKSKRELSPEEKLKIRQRFLSNK